MNLICMPSILNKSNQLLAYPAEMTTQAALKAVNSLIAQSQTTVHKKLAPGATTGQFESQLLEHLLEQLRLHGFKLINPDGLQRTKQWNRYPSD